MSSDLVLRPKAIVAPAQALPIPWRTVPKRDVPRNEQGASVMSNEIDLHLGKRLRRRRRLLGLTQQQLAGAVGVRFQQIQKYECGANRISAARLWQLSEALEVPIGYFYDGLSIAPITEQPVERHEANGEMLARKETMDLIRAYYQLGERPRRRLLDLAKSLNGEVDAQ
jgi:transcriptional regulator with XRE-family HTH domain